MSQLTWELIEGLLRAEQYQEAADLLQKDGGKFVNAYHEALLPYALKDFGAFILGEGKYQGGGWVRG